MMPPATSQDPPAGCITPFSSPRFVPYNFWSPTDLVIGAGAVILDASKSKVLVLWDPVTSRYRFPWAKHDKDDLGQFVVSPFEQIADETGYTLEKLALPKLSRRYANPDARDWEDLQVEVCIDPAPKSATDDPFFMTFDVFWFRVPEYKRFDSRQRMLMWFACRVVDGAPAHENVVWMGFEEAATWLAIGRHGDDSTEQSDSDSDSERHVDNGSCAALKQLVAILENPGTQLAA